MIALIMAGGSGTRFWPASRASKPKQFLEISGNKSMIQLTVERLLPIIPIQDIYIVTAASQVPLIRQHLSELPDKNIIIEPFGMNTAACIALSCTYLQDFYEANTSMIVLPADHLIQKLSAFHASIARAEAKAREGGLITFGIVPEYPATGYGYIEAGEKETDGSHRVLRFKEKPDYATAQGFLAQGNFFWNSGMFAWQLSAIDLAFTRYLPQMHELCQQISRRWESEGYSASIDDIYAEMPRLPIDIGIMEKVDKLHVFPVDLGWSDVGGWKALYDTKTKDKDGNYSAGETLFIDAKANYIDSKKYIALIGIDNLCVVESPDAILICPLDKSEEVKQVVDTLKAQKRDELL